LAATTTEFAPSAKAQSESDPLAEMSDETLYRHKKRPEWGVAILAWEKEKRRAYQFEDGKLRKFKKGYYALMQPAKRVERPRDVLLSSLRAAARSYKNTTPSTTLSPTCSFRDQVGLFAELYPDGFKGEKWIQEHRTPESGRTLKRHRTPAVQKAQELLNQEASEAYLAEERYDELVAGIHELLSGTSLVPIRSVKPLEGMEDDQAREFSLAVHGLLHGEEAYEARFKNYLEVLQEIYGGRPSWRVATALPALVFPEKQTCVRRSVYLRQAGSVMPAAKYTKKARPKAYGNFRRVAFAVKKRLEAEGHEPADLLDVHDFIWLTLRNAALDSIKD